LGCGLLDGIPQSNLTLGSKRARSVLYEVAELQCPFCAQFAKGILPAVIRRYVRTSKIRMYWNGVTFIGPDSVRADRFALAAGRQNLLWNFIDAFYAHQHTENSGYVTDGFLTRVAHTIPGLSVTRAMGARNSSFVSGELADANNFYDQIGDPRTPFFFVIGRSGKARVVQFNALTVDAFTRGLDHALAQG
jgi:hypothetical protein